MTDHPQLPERPSEFAAKVRQIIMNGTPHDRPLDRQALFKVGDRVRAKNLNPTAHNRLPGFTKGKVGIIDTYHGAHLCHEPLSVGEGEVPEYIYAVKFELRSFGDRLPKQPVMPFTWISSSTTSKPQSERRGATQIMSDHNHETLDAHGHTHGHKHDDHYDTWVAPSEIEARVRAFESLLVEKNITTHDAIDTLVATFENDLGPMHGARVVAKAWTDPAYRQRLTEDGTSAIAELGYRGLQTEHVKAMFNTPTDHHMWVCTLCSCFPWTLLGIPPVWFKSPPYRAKVVSHPRDVLRDFGYELPIDVKVHVWDTSAEQRYLVVPLKPEGTDDLNEDQLAAFVTRDSMIGTGLPLTRVEWEALR